MLRSDQISRRPVATRTPDRPRSGFHAPARPPSLSSAVAPVLVLILALGALGACGDDVPPGARPISEAAPSSVPPADGGAGAPTPQGAPAGPTVAPASAPRAVEFDPPNGATDVDPARTTLSVTFDQQMNPQDWAWVVESAETAPKIGEARFDPMARVNTVDVQLEPGRDYVVWINSDQYQYFRGLDGTPAVPVRWTFSTRGGEAGSGAGAPVGMVSSRPQAPAADAPRVVALDPANGATGVDPSRSTISVTFDRPMSEGWAWVTEEGTTAPTTVGKPTFSPDRKTNSLPVELAPNTTYTIWVNSDTFAHFRDEFGTPAQPVRWTFTTGPGG